VLSEHGERREFHEHGARSGVTGVGDSGDREGFEDGNHIVDAVPEDAFDAAFQQQKITVLEQNVRTVLEQDR
jgi:hypothetical protein